MKLRAVGLGLMSGLVLAGGVCAQPQDTSKQSVEKRLRDVQKDKASLTVEKAIDALEGANSFGEVTVSPDGKKVAWVEKLHDKSGMETGKSAIVATTIDGKAPLRKITAATAGGQREEKGIAWSPDSRRVAFLSDAAAPGQLQLYVEGASGQPSKRLTNVKGFLDAPKFSPNGKTIAVLFTENATRAAGPLVAETAETGVIKDAFFEQRLALADVATGKLRQISPADTYVYEYDWAPDNLHLVVTSALGNGDNNWWIAELSVLDATTGLMKSIYKPSYQINFPAWSPDGKSIAFIEGLMSDFGSVGGDVMMISAEGGKPKNLTSERKASASSLSWTKDGKIIAGEFVGGDSSVIAIDPATDKIEQLYRGADEVTAGTWGPSVSTSDGKVVAAVRSSFAGAPEVWAGGIGDWKQITQRNKNAKPAWGEVKSLKWKSDSFEVQGWLVYPANFDATKKYPMVVDVHGGPSAAVQSKWPGSGDWGMALAASGYFVLLPNPRGSYGQGEAFTRANVRDFGNGDLRDILAGVDEALKVAPIDANRLGITGWSYGGYMTMFAVTQTNRFKAAMAGAGIANLQSYYGENKIDQWMIPFFGKSVYDDPEIYAKSSPITFIKKVKTPTLVMVGDSDGECPTPQSYEFWHALKTLGVETQLVVYEHEGHHFSNPEHLRDRVRRTVAWFDGHLQQH